MKSLLLLFSDRNSAVPSTENLGKVGETIKRKNLLPLEQILSCKSSLL